MAEQAGSAAASAAAGQYTGTTVTTTRYRSQWALWARALTLEAGGQTAGATRRTGPAGR